MTNKPGTQSGDELSLFLATRKRHNIELRSTLCTLFTGMAQLSESRLYSVGKLQRAARLVFEAFASAGDHSDSQLMKSKGPKEAQSFHCHLDKSLQNQRILPLIFSSSKMVMFTLKHLYCTVAA